MWDTDTSWPDKGTLFFREFKKMVDSIKVNNV